MADLGQGCTDHEPAERMGRCQTRCARGRGAMLRAGDADQDVSALFAGRSDGEDAGLGGRRARRLPADLKPSIGRGAFIMTIASICRIAVPYLALVAACSAAAVFGITHV